MFSCKNLSADEMVGGEWAYWFRDQRSVESSEGQTVWFQKLCEMLHVAKYYYCRLPKFCTLDTMRFFLQKNSTSCCAGFLAVGVGIALK